MWDKCYLCITIAAMESQFKNLQQLITFFKDEEVCKAYLEQQRWAGNVACPHCGSIKVYRTNRGFKCGEKLCAKKFSVTVGTIFENSKIKLQTWFAAMFLISTSKKGVSSLQLAGQLDITQKSAWFLLHRIREMLKEKSTEKFTGTVEIDETYVGGKNKNRHHNKKSKGMQGAQDKAMVIGVIERNGKVRTKVMPNTQLPTMRQVIYDNVETSAEVITDAHNSYKTLHEDNYTRHTIIKKEPFNYVTDRYFHTNNIEGYWAILKRGIYGIYHQVSPKHLQKYCDEFGYRFNTRTQTNIERFEDAVSKVSSARITYKGLIGK